MKIKRKIVAFMIAMAIVLSGVGSPTKVDAACSSYTEYRKEKAFCDNTDGCGFLWKKDTLKHKSYQEHYCPIKGKQVRRTRTTYVVDGCC